MLYVVLRFLSWLILKLFFGLEVKGAKNVPQDGGFILASNHVSYFDPVVVGVGVRRRLNYMARHDLFDNLFFGWLLKRLGVFPVKRDSADLSALKRALRLVKAGSGMLLFPEGRRRDAKDTLTHPEPGVGFLAQKSGVPVIPVFVKGTDKVLPRQARFPRFKKISLHFGRRVEIEEKLSYQEIAELVTAGIKQLAF